MSAVLVTFESYGVQVHSASLVLHLLIGVPSRFKAPSSESPDVRSLGRSDVRTLGRSDAWTLGRPDARTLGRPGVRTPGRSDACPPLCSIFAFVATRARPGPSGRAGRAAPPWRRPSPRPTQKLRKTSEKRNGAPSESPPVNY